MSRDIDLSDLDALSEDDIRYLAARDRLPAELRYQLEDDPEVQAALDQSQGRLVRDTPHTGSANTGGETIEELERRLERMRAEQTEEEAASAFTPEVPEDEEDDEDDESDESDDVEDYSNERGWNNDKRRAELASRNLDTSGDKEALIARLMESDAAGDEDEEE